MTDVLVAHLEKLGAAHRKLDIEITLTREEPPAWCQELLDAAQGARKRYVVKRRNRILELRKP